MNRLLIGSLIIVIFSSCAHRFMRGTVTMKINEDIAHVCLGDQDVEVGNKLSFYTHSCDSTAGKESGMSGNCTLEILGTGTVTKLFNHHYSEVKLDKKFQFREGTLVQKVE